MNQPKLFESSGAVVARKTQSNPEGKGLNGLLLDWCQSEPRGVVAKPQRQILAEDNPVSDAIGRFYDAFAETFDTDLTLEEILPFYVGTSPYYQRLCANALSRSVRAAVTLGDQGSTRCRQWYMLLPQLKNVMLAPGG